MSNKKIPNEYLDLLDINKVLKDTKDVENLKVTLKHNNMKGAGLYATKNICAGETIAYYQIKAFDYRHYVSPTNYVYAFDIYTLTGNESKNLIGDIDLNSFPEPLNNIPFWAAFVNEPSIGEKLNSEINLNIDENYKNKKRIRSGNTLIYKLVATCNISHGDEITLYYGKDYPRMYEIDVAN